MQDAGSVFLLKPDGESAEIAKGLKIAAGVALTGDHRLRRRRWQRDSVLFPRRPREGQGIGRRQYPARLSGRSPGRGAAVTSLARTERSLSGGRIAGERGER